MAQSAEKGKTILGLEPFWDKPSSNPPTPWEKWRSQLKMALVPKTNIELDDLLREKPTTIIYPPELVEEQPVQNPTQTMERERLTRYNQAIAKWKNECNIIDRIGVLCGDKPWDIADIRAKSMIYLTIGIEGRRMHTRKYPHTNVENITTQQLWEELELTFIRPRNVTFDRYLLLTRRQQKGETVEQFHSALRSLAEFCQLGALEDDLLRDIFTANMIDPEIQKELLKVTLEPEKALELAISIELGARSQLAIQAKNTTDSSMVTIVGRSEPVLAISSSRYRGNYRGNFSQPQGNYQPPRGNSHQSNRQQFQQHNCRNCVQPWTQEHRSKCQAIGQTCRRCNKPNHLAKVCRSNMNRYTNNRNVNEIIEQDETQNEEQINMVSLNNEKGSIREDSEDDYMVNLISPTETSPTPTKLHIKFGNTKYWVMVDSGSSNSLVTERMAHEIEDRDKNSWWSRKTNPTNLRSFTNTPIRNVGTLYCDIECNGWNAGRADLIVVPNNHRAIIGRDLFQGLGIQVNQQPSPKSEGKQIALIQNVEGQNLKTEISKKFPNLIRRIGLSKTHTVKSKFKTNFTPVHQRGRRIPIHLQSQVEEELKKLEENHSGINPAQTHQHHGKSGEVS